MRFGESVKREVVSTSDAETVGRVKGFVVDPSSQRVTAVHLGRTSGDGDYVSWDDIVSFGQDAVTVPDASVLRAANDDVEREVGGVAKLIGKLVLSDVGRELGKVEDVEFDPDTGRLTTIITDREQLAGSRLRGVGSYAVVVHRT